MRRRFLLLSNRHAGLSSSNLVDATIACLRARSVEVIHQRPQSVDEARVMAHAAAVEGDADAVVACGGDGTIRQIGAALIGTRMPLAIIPGGTGNVLAHEIGLQRTPHAIADMLIDGREVRLSVARANGEPFLLMAGAGLDARVLQHLDSGLKGMMGKVAYTMPLLEALAQPLETLQVDIEGKSYEASWAIIANAQHYGGGFVLTRMTDITQRGLVAVLFKTRLRAVLMTQILSLARGQLEARADSMKDVELIPCQRAVVTAHPAVPVQLDGDPFGTTPMSAECTTDALQLVVPQGCTLR